MPILLILLLIVLIAQFGFWDTFAAILGAVGMVILLLMLVGGIAATLAYILFRRVRRRF